jgi:hypothetical protein
MLDIAQETSGVAEVPTSYHYIGLPYRYWRREVAGN